MTHHRGRRPPLACALIAAAVVAISFAPMAATAHHFAPIQPGAPLQVDCTLNFIFEDGDGALYTATAGRCYEGPGETARTAGGDAFGTVVYHDDEDFTSVSGVSLISIDPGWHDRVDPSVRHWGGPTGVAGAPAHGSTTFHYGHGVGYGNAEPTRPRRGVVVDAHDDTGVYIRTHPFSFGDDGGPILDEDGRAVGLLDAVLSTISTEPEATMYWHPTMPSLLDHLAVHGWDLSVVTAPVNGDVVDRQVTQAVHCSSAPIGPDGCVSAP